ncbi:MAG: RNA polymerase-binding protein DksA [Mariprofundales bacterium]
MSLSPQQISEFKEYLQQWQHDLEQGATQNLRKDMGNGVKEGFPDPNDQASMESEREFNLRIRERERRLIRKIEQTLASIGTGKFGICHSCNNDIAYARLKARPVTNLCIDCKTAQETTEHSNISSYKA